MKLAAVVVVYHPTLHVIANIRSYSFAAEKVWVLDNSEREQREFKTELDKISNCAYYSDGNNAGIAARLNEACMAAREAGYEWILTMDQDSSFDDANIKRYLSCIETDANKMNVAMYGVYFLSPDIQSPVCSPLSVSQLITSGSIVNLSLFSLVGRFNEDLFIDQVDFDYCYRSIAGGYQVIQFQNIFLQHTMGNISEHRSLLNFKKTQRSLHSPERLYYMTRNYLYIRSRYHDRFREGILHSRKDLWRRIKNNFLYNPKRFLALQYVLRGYFDYKKGRVGKLRK